MTPMCKSYVCTDQYSPHAEEAWDRSETDRRQKHFWTTTTMSNQYLLPELLDIIADILHDSRNALKNCCLVSKSWVPRTRKHLFANVKFRTTNDVESWKSAFPDPSTSPAHHTKTLSIESYRAAAAVGVEEGGWIRSFSCAVRLEIGLAGAVVAGKPINCLFPFHGFSPALKSLRLSHIPLPLPLIFIFDLIHSFPHLEDLYVIDPVPRNFRVEESFDGQPTTVQYPNPPAFTGSLRLHKIGRIAPQLLSLPSGLHFRKLHLTWYTELDVSWTTSFVESCCFTLESLCVDPGHGMSAACPHPRRWLTPAVDASSQSVDLSKATKLKDVTFISYLTLHRWIAATLQTATPNHRDLQRISINIREWMEFTSDACRLDLTRFRRSIEESASQGWSEIDHLLTRLSESRPIRLRFMYGPHSPLGEEGARLLVERFLPEVTARGMVDMVEQ